MVVTDILILRHGHRLAWSLDPTTGKYTSNHPFPTRRPADPPLASHGVRQAQETGAHLSSLLFDLACHDKVRIYSSLFYRCLETLRPTIEALRSRISAEYIGSERDKLLRSLEVRGERGVGEWFGKAWFEQPSPADALTLRDTFFPWIDVEYESRIIPDRHGERIESLHDRVAIALAQIIDDVDQEFRAAGRGDEHVTILICGHAAQIICTGRVLTGIMPEDADEEDFHCYTCGISKFTRRKMSEDKAQNGPLRASENWKTSGGVTGGWDCILNSDCTHLTQGEERGWHFHGDESFDSYGPGSRQGPILSDGGIHTFHERANDSNQSNPKL